MHKRMGGQGTRRSSSRSQPRAADPRGRERLGSSCLGLLSKYWLPPFLGEKAKTKPGQEAADAQTGPRELCGSHLVWPQRYNGRPLVVSNLFASSKKLRSPPPLRGGSPRQPRKRCPQAAFFQSSSTANQAGLPSQGLSKNTRRAAVETQGLPSPGPPALFQEQPRISWGAGHRNSTVQRPPVGKKGSPQRTSRTDGGRGRPGTHCVPR